MGEKVTVVAQPRFHGLQVPEQLVVQGMPVLVPLDLQVGSLPLRRGLDQQAPTSPHQVELPNSQAIGLATVALRNNNLILIPIPGRNLSRV